MNKKILTDQEDQKLRELMSTGEYSYSDVAKFFPNYSKEQITNYCFGQKIKGKTRKLWTQEEHENVKKWCEEGMDFEDMVPLLNNRWTADKIHKYCIRKKIYNIKFNFWSNEEKELLKNLLDTGMYRHRDLPQFFPKRNFGTIRAQIIRMGLKTKHKNSCYVFDQDYFNQPTIINSYIAGYWMADGCIYKDNRDNKYSFRINLSLRDKSFIDLVQKEIKSNHKLRIYKKKSPGSDNIYDYVSFGLGGIDNWIDPLFKYFGMCSQKTKRFPAPNLTDIKHKLAYILGYFDGDGSVSVGKDNILALSVCSSNKTILEYIRDLFESFNIPRLNNAYGNNLILDARDNKSLYIYRVGGFRACVIYEILMRLNIPCLERKWKKLEILELVNTAKARPEWPEESFFQNILNQ